MPQFYTWEESGEKVVEKERGLGCTTVVVQEQKVQVGFRAINERDYYELNNKIDEVIYA